MMVAMMLPSATPAILLYATVRKSRQPDKAIAQPWVFLAGYLLVWLVFSVVAALIQARLPSAAMGLESRTAQAALLIAAGLYQLSSLKSACISQCRSPAQFISRNWRAGTAGAVRLGILHGAYCVGCCWALMTLLFVGGVMNLAWIIALTIVVTAEKLLPGQLLLQRTSGAALIACGAIRLVD
jgi:predicted metal-binding membrane protein